MIGTRASLPQAGAPRPARSSAARERRSQPPRPAHVSASPAVRRRAAALSRPLRRRASPPLPPCGTWRLRSLLALAADGATYAGVKGPWPAAVCAAASQRDGLRGGGRAVAAELGHAARAFAGHSAAGPVQQSSDSWLSTGPMEPGFRPTGSRSVADLHELRHSSSRPASLDLPPPSASPASDTSSASSMSCR